MRSRPCDEEQRGDDVSSSLQNPDVDGTCSSRDELRLVEIEEETERRADQEEGVRVEDQTVFRAVYHLRSSTESADILLWRRRERGTDLLG